MNHYRHLPYDHELEDPTALVEWIKAEGVGLEFHEMEGYPTVPLHFSDYIHEPATIVIYRYPAIEEWLNLMSQNRVGYYGSWYYLHIAYHFYCYLELNGRYEIKRNWYHLLMGRLITLEDRAFYFTQSLLGTLYHPKKFDDAVAASFRPGTI